MKQLLFHPVTVGRVGRLTPKFRAIPFFKPVSRPTGNHQTKYSMWHGGLDTPRMARGYSTTGVGHHA
jgi:hypothetical protein